MQVLEFNGKSYKVDADEFLLDSSQWDVDFAEGIARRNGIPEGLTDAHWIVLKCVREHFLKTGKCPVAYEICRECNLGSADLARLFPLGSHRGACKIAGITYFSQYPAYIKCAGRKNPIADRVYRVDIAGYLIDPDEWDCDFAIFRMRERRMPEASDLHFEIIQYLRKKYYDTRQIPTADNICSDNQIDLEDFEALFPGDYYGAALRIAGLRPVSVTAERL